MSFGLKVGTINIQGGFTAKKDLLVRECSRFGLDVLALCDVQVSERRTYFKREDTIGNEGHKVILSGVKNGKAKLGVGLLMGPGIEKRMLNFECVSERIMWARFSLRDMICRVVVVYAPCDSDSAEVKDGFYSHLEEVVTGVGGDKLIVLGDFNGRIGSDNRGFENVMGKWGEKKSNGNGNRLLDFCMGFGLVITNSFFNHKMIHKYTWENPTRRLRSILDYVLVSADIRRFVLDTRVYRGFEFGSDHYLVCSFLRISWERAKIPRIKCKRIKIERLNNISTVNEFKEHVATARYEDRGMQHSGEETRGIEQEWAKYKNSLLEASKEVLGETVCKDYKRRTPWWNEEVRNAVKEKKRAYKKWQQTRREEDLQFYREKRKIVSKTVSEAKKRSWERFGEFIENAGQEGGKLFWGTIKSLRGRGMKQSMISVKNKDGDIIVDQGKVMDRWRSYFDDLLNVGEVQLDSETNRDIGMTCEDDGAKIRREEVRCVIRNLKNGKAAGSDDIRAEMIKNSGEIGISWLYDIIELAWETGKVPDDWAKAVIVPIYKKGDKKDCGNYRGISLLSVPGKIYAGVLERKLRSIVEKQLDDSQCGFRPLRGCQDQIFSLRQISEKYYEKGKDVFSCFIDLEKAYDRVPREKLLEVLGRYGVGNKLLRAIDSLYTKSMAAVRIDGKLSDWFQVKTGVRQGCKLSPLLFIIYMNEIIKNSNFEGGLNLGNNKIVSLAYADDLVILAESEGELQTNINKFNASCLDFGMKISVGKTKVMKISKKGGEIKCKIDQEGIEQVASFTYLGCIISEDGKLDNELESRISKANAVSCQLRNTLFNKKEVSTKTKLSVHRAIFRPILMYGSESWVDTNSKIQKLEVTDMRVLRMISGVRRWDQWQERISNDSIRNQLGVTDIDEAARQSRLRWWGHVQRMGEDRLPKQILESFVGGKRGRGRPRRRWEDSVGNDLDVRGFSWEEARGLALDRGKWRRVVKGRVSGRTP